MNKGWYWDDVTKQLYKWDDLIKLLRKRKIFGSVIIKTRRKILLLKDLKLNILNLGLTK